MHISAALLAKIAHNQCGTTLVLENINNTQVATLLDPLRGNLQLRDIGLCYKANEAAQGQLLAKIVSNMRHTVTAFTLSLSQLDTLSPITDALRGNQQLSTLHLIIKSFPQLSSEDVCHEMRVFLEMIILQTKITTLKLVGMPLDDSGAYIMALSLPQRRTPLSELWLNTPHPISAAGIETLTQAMAQHTHATEFSFLSTSPHLTATLALYMLELLKINIHLTYIDIRGKNEHEKFCPEWGKVRTLTSCMVTHNRLQLKLAKAAPPLPYSFSAIAPASPNVANTSRGQGTLNDYVNQKHAFQDYRKEVNNHPRVMEYYLGLHGLLDDTVIAFKSVNSGRVRGNNRLITPINTGDHVVDDVITAFCKVTILASKLNAAISVLSAVLTCVNEYYLQTVAYRISRIFIDSEENGRIIKAIALILADHQQDHIKTCTTLMQLSTPYRTYLEACHWFNGQGTLTEICHKVREDVQKILHFFYEREVGETPTLARWFPALLENFGIPIITGMQKMQEFFPEECSAEAPIASLPQRRHSIS